MTHTTIPKEIHTHRVYVSKNESTELSRVRFERQALMIEEL